MLNAHRIYLSAPRRTPKCTCTSVVAWQKKILHAVAAALWFFYLQLYKSSQLSTLVLSSNAWKAWKMKPKSRFFYKGMCITFTLKNSCYCCLLCPKGQFVAIELLSNLRFVGFCFVLFQLQWDETETTSSQESSVSNVTAENPLLSSWYYTQLRPINWLLWRW